MIYKPEIRRRIRARRKQMDSSAIQQASEQAAIQCIQLPQLIEAKHIAYYIADEGELDPSFITNTEHAQHKLFYLPKLNSDQQLEFYQHDSSKKLAPNQFGILEPDTYSNNSNIAAEELDIVFTPLVAFDQRGNRIGRGAGCYDKTFQFKLNSHKKPLLVGLAYEFQKIDDFDSKEWDVPLDMIITEKHIYLKP